MSAAERMCCPICGAAREPLPGSCPDAWFCGRCRHTFIGRLPPADVVERIYDDYGYDAVDRAAPPAFLDVILGEVVDSFLDHRRTGRLLDVGFGEGGFLRVARARGWETHGVEMSAPAVELAVQRRLGTVHHGDFRTLPLPEAGFDVVIMSELIEHLPEPIEFLRRAGTLLRPGGLLYITTPHGRGLSGRFLKASWSLLCPPDHLQLFSVDSMRRLLADAGFHAPRIYTQGVLPHEIVRALRARIRPGERSTLSGDAPIIDHEERLSGGYRLNELLTKGPAGKLVKRTVNGVLRTTTLGDSLRVHAIR